MSDVILNSVLVSFLLIMLGVGIYIRFREQIIKSSVNKKFSELKLHFNKHRYWYWGIAVVFLIPLLYHVWEVSSLTSSGNRYLHRPNDPPPIVTPTQSGKEPFSISEFLSIFTIIYPPYWNNPIILVYTIGILVILLILFRPKSRNDLIIFRTLSCLTIAFLFTVLIGNLVLWSLVLLVANSDR